MCHKSVKTSQFRAKFRAKYRPYWLYMGSKLTYFGPKGDMRERKHFGVFDHVRVRL